LSRQRTKRQMPMIPGGVVTNRPFPRGNRLMCYIPYRVEIRDPDAGVVGIILVKPLTVQLDKEPLSHLAAMGIFSKGRKELWKEWMKFKNNLEYNDIRVSDEISESRERLSEIHRKGLWQSDPEFVNQINVGHSLSGDKTYSINFPYSKKAEVVGLVMIYQRNFFRPVYDIPEEASNKYWEFVTEYIRKFGIASPDWNNPEVGKDLPPLFF